jgi:hypothetical protein
MTMSSRRTNGFSGVPSASRVAPGHDERPVAIFVHSVCGEARCGCSLWLLTVAAHCGCSVWGLGTGLVKSYEFRRRPRRNLATLRRSKGMNE